MAENSGISWTDHTFNPWIGCTKVSEGCKNCYAERDFDKRRHVVEWGKGKPRVRTAEANWKKPLTWNRKAEKDGTRPRVFCASLADWLDPEVPIEWLADLLELIQETPHLDWLLLTKRPEMWQLNMLTIRERGRNDGGCPGFDFACRWLDGDAPKNVWIGTTVENQKATARIPHLLRIPAVVRFLSCEPLLGPIDLRAVARPDDAYMNTLGHTGVITTIEEPDDYLYWSKKGIDWVICGGESGPNARPMHPDWARGLRDQCLVAGVPFHFKQWGEWGDFTNGPVSYARADHVFLASGEVIGAGYRHGRKSWGMVEDKWFERGAAWMCRVGVKAAGRLLDGVEHNEFPLVGETV